METASTADTLGPPTGTTRPRLAYPPGSLFTATYEGNAGAPAANAVLHQALRGMSDVYEIPTFYTHQFGAEPDVTANQPWSIEAGAHFASEIEAVGEFIAAMLDNERIPLRLADQIALADKTRAQWIAYAHGMCTTFTSSTTEGWGLLWKIPLTPPKRRGSWTEQGLADWLSVAEPWVWMVNDFPRIGIMLETFTGVGIDALDVEDDWVPQLIENTRALFPDKPIYCTVAPSVKINGVVIPLSVDDGLEIVERRFHGGADGIQLFPLVKHSRDVGGWLSESETESLAESCKAMSLHAAEMWGEEGLATT